MDFNGFNLHPKILKAVQTAGFATPTPIQAKSIPVTMAGRDVLGLAQTGTGKTAAFALPILNRLATKPGRKIRALIVVPTRELAQQIHEHFVMLGSQVRARCTTVYGGVGYQPQLMKLKTADIVVACPGRLLDHARRGTIDLSAVEMLVLDEADRMFDMGFLPEIRNIIKFLPAERQTMLFSATMPDELRHLADEVLREPTTIKVDAELMACTVSHAIYPIKRELKTSLLLNLLGTTGPGSVLVFTKTKHLASRVAEKLSKEGIKSSSLQGNLSQNKRQAAITAFRKGEIRVLVATDIAARGIDVASVSHVINYDMPNTVEDYTHRTGRTGRACRTGDAFSFVTRDDESLVRAIERTINAKLERRYVQSSELPAPTAEELAPERAPRRSFAPKKTFGRNDGTNGGRSDARNDSRKPWSRDNRQPRRSYGGTQAAQAG